MKFYHGTTEEFWEEIKKEGVLWGRKNEYWEGRKMDRITYLTPDIKYAGLYDDKGLTDKECVILEIDLPEVVKWDYWEFVTYDPIPITQIKKI